MIIIGDDSTSITFTKSKLYTLFDIKDLSNLHYFLGIEVASSPQGYILSPFKNTLYLFICGSLTNICTTDTPLEVHSKLTSLDGIPLEDPS